MAFTAITKKELAENIQKAQALLQEIETKFSRATNLRLNISLTTERVNAFRKMFELRNKELEKLRSDSQQEIQEGMNEEALQEHYQFKKTNSLSKDTLGLLQRSLKTLDNEILKQTQAQGSLESIEKKQEYDALIKGISEQFSARQDFKKMYLIDSALNQYVQAIEDNVDQFIALLKQYKHLENNKSATGNEAQYAKAIEAFNQFKEAHAALEKKAEDRYLDLQVVYMEYQGKMETTQEAIQKARDLIKRASVFERDPEVKSLINALHALVDSIEKKDYLSTDKGSRSNFKSKYGLLTPEWERDLTQLIQSTHEFATQMNEKEASSEFQAYKAAIQEKDRQLLAAQDALKKAESLKDLREFKAPYASLKAKTKEIAKKEYQIEFGPYEATLEERIDLVPDVCAQDVRSLSQLVNNLNTKTQSHFEKIRQEEEALQANNKAIQVKIGEQIAAVEDLRLLILGKLNRYNLKTDSIDKVIEKFDAEVSRQGDIRTLQAKHHFLSEKLTNLQKIKTKLELKSIEKDKEISRRISHEIGLIINKVIHDKEEIKTNISEGRFNFNAKEEALYTELIELKIAPDHYRKIDDSTQMEKTLHDARVNKTHFDALVVQMNAVINLHNEVKNLSIKELITKINEQRISANAVEILQVWSQYHSLLKMMQPDHYLLSLNATGRAALAAYVDTVAERNNADARLIATKLGFLEVLVDNRVIPTSQLLKEVQIYSILIKFPFGKKFMTADNLNDWRFREVIKLFNTKGITFNERLLDALTDKNKLELIYNLAKFQDLSNGEFEYLLDLALKADEATVQSFNHIYKTSPALFQPWLLVLALDETVLNENLQKILGNPDKIILNLPFIDYLFNDPFINDVWIKHYLTAVTSPSQNGDTVAGEALGIKSYLQQRKHTFLDPALTRLGCLEKLVTMNNEDNFIFASTILAGINKIAESTHSREETLQMERYRAEAVSILFSDQPIAIQKGQLINTANELFPPETWGSKLLDAIKSYIISAYAMCFSQQGKEHEFRFFDREGSRGRDAIRRIVLGTDRSPATEPSTEEVLPAESGLGKNPDGQS